MSTTVPARWKRASSVAVTVMLGVSLLGSVTARGAGRADARTAAAPGVVAAAAARSAHVHWRPCRDGFQCARIRLPLDYDRPGGAKISVSVIRLPAADRAHRIGPLFMNPGGPGGSGVDLVRELGQFLPLELRGRFDLVGFDPRGVLASTPLRCYRTFDQAFRDQPDLAFPVTTKQENRQIRSDRKLARACRTHAGPILGHMSTADVARDMDAIRSAMGERRLSYFGYSYGSILGQTYANMFPRRARALVIDGVLDPRAWAGKGAQGHKVPVGTRLHSSLGAQNTLREFFRLCDAARADCAFSGHASRRFAALTRRLRAHPLDEGDGFTFGYSDLVALTLSGLYSSDVWSDLADVLKEIESEASPARLQAALSRLRTKLGLAAKRQEDYPNIVESFPGVLCSDANTPRSYRALRRYADRTERRSYFGRLWNWSGSACTVWPRRAGQDRYTGPWTHRTRNPVLVVGNFHDPATPYRGAVAASRLLPNSRLLSYAGWGHTAFFTGNFCIDNAVTSYLVTTRPPAKGTVCRPAGSPFETFEALRTPAATAALAATIPAAVRRAVGHR